MGAEAVALIVATFGETVWEERARRAAALALDQQPGELVVEHGATLADARNAGARRTAAPWLCFLDADDELEPGYLATLADADHRRRILRAPAVRFVTAGEPEPDPVSLAGRNISALNPCVVGTLIPRHLFELAGGWGRERAWEDWALFHRCHLAGAEIEHVPAAVYRVNVNPAGRNSTIANPERLHREIRQANARWARQLRKVPAR